MSISINYTQKEIQTLFLPILRDKGTIFQKSKNIFARPGILGERIITTTSDGKETENIVTDKGSFIVKNQTDAAEEYIVTKAKFEERYKWLRPAENDYAEYRPMGKIIAIKLTRKLWGALDFPTIPIYFEAPWRAPMILKKYDYMVCPLDFSEVYRIARKEFWETYK